LQPKLLLADEISVSKFSITKIYLKLQSHSLLYLWLVACQINTGMHFFPSTLFFLFQNVQNCFRFSELFFVPMYFISTKTQTYISEQQILFWLPVGWPNKSNYIPTRSNVHRKDAEDMKANPTIQGLYLNLCFRETGEALLYFRNILWRLWTSCVGCHYFQHDLFNVVNLQRQALWITLIGALHQKFKLVGVKSDEIHCRRLYFFSIMQKMIRNPYE